MKVIGAEAQAKLNERTAQESVLIVRCWWNEAAYQYSDKVDLTRGVFGRVLEVSGLDQVINVNGSGVSQNVTVKLDDADGSLLELIQHTDIHKKRVQILQWFPGMGYEQAFVLIEGYCNTPFNYSEADRTFTFTVLSLIEDLEMGFSIDTMLGTPLPLTLPDVAFPVVFGSVAKVPAAQLTDPPELVLQEGFCVVHEEVYAREIKDLSDQLVETEKRRSDLYFQGYEKMVEAAKYQDGDDGAFDDPDFPDSQDAYEAAYNAGMAFYQQSEEAAQDATEIRQQMGVISRDRDQKRKYARGSVQIQSENCPAGIDLVVDADGLLLRAKLQGNTLVLGEKINKVKLRAGQKYVAEVYDRFVNRVYRGEDEAGERYTWIGAGTALKIINLPAYHAACLGADNTIHGVYGYRRGVKVRLPEYLYTLEQHAFTNPDTDLQATAWIVVLRQDLSTVTNEIGEPVYESPRVWCDITSTVGPNPAEILSWAAATFASVVPHPAQLAAVTARCEASPMNFAVLDKVPVIQFINDVAYQARTAVWFVGKTMHMRYLPEEPVPDGTITPDDVVEMTLDITCDDSDRVVTKMVAEWKRTVAQDTTHKLVVKNNVEKYGLREERYNYTCFNARPLVERAAGYWMIRKSNVWKRLKLKVFAHKAGFDCMDAVRMEGWADKLFCNHDVTGIVEGCVYDSSDHTVDLTIWLPVRWHEMDQYKWAYPAFVADKWGMEPNEFRTGSPFDVVEDTTGIVTRIGYGFVPRGPDKEFFKDPGEEGHVVSDLEGAGGEEWRANFVLDPQAVYLPQATNFPQTLQDMNDGKGYTLPNGTVSPGLPPPGAQPSGAGLRSAYSQADLAASNPPVLKYRLQPLNEPEEDTGKGSVVEIGTVSAAIGGGVYLIQPFPSGTPFQAVQIAVREGYQISVGMPVVCVKKGKKYYFQAPVWSPESQ